MTNVVTPQNYARSHLASWCCTIIAALLLVLAAGPVTAAATTPSIESMPLWRLQVRFTTGTTSTAGTEGHPAVRFNGSSTGVRTLNPPAAAAFDRGRVDTDDLRLFSSPAEITMLRVGIAGSDDWCVKKVELILNGRVAFAQDTVPGGACATIKAGTYVEYSSASLRSNPAWKAFGAPPTPPTSMSGSELSARVTAVTGAAFLGASHLSWRTDVPLTVRQTTSRTISIRFGYVLSDGVDYSEGVLTYEVLLSRGTDGQLHASRRSVSNGSFPELIEPVIAHLDAALSRMTARPAPHDPLQFGVDLNSNISWYWRTVTAP